jgi:putative SOS response-associated peptidase YedK
MCFHLAATSAAKTLEARFNAMFPESNLFEPAEEFNAFAHPTLPVIVEGKPDQIELFNWGLVPGWVKDNAMADKMKKATLNARIETAFDKPSFKEPMRFQRCIIPANAFYEWKHEQVRVESRSTKTITDKTKYKITTDQEVFAFAGLWDSWQEWKGFSILTMPANPLMARIHNTAKRMPFILTPENEQKWLDPERVKLYDIQELIVPYPEEMMRAEPVTRDE